MSHQDRSDPHAHWISHPQAADEAVFAFRLAIEAPSQTSLSLCLTADERFRLFVNGKFVGEGPHRCDPDHWCYHTFDLDLLPGPNTIVVMTWSVGQRRAVAQLSVMPGMAAWVCGEPAERFSTGHAPWQVARVNGYAFIDAGDISATGARVRIDGTQVPWGFETGMGEPNTGVLDWTDPVQITRATRSVFHGGNELHRKWTLVPTPLPKMERNPAPAPRVRHARTNMDKAIRHSAFDRETHDHSIATNWQAMLAGQTPLTIAANQTQRVLLDAENYLCAFAEITTTGGKDACVQIRWAESLFLDAKPVPNWPFGPPKGNRDVIDGKYFHGVGNEYIIGGGEAPRTYRPLWWEAGRYIELLITTANEPLTIHALDLIETGYPLETDGRFESSDPVHTQIIRLGTRSLRMCSHETHMDCPYYEQLQYVGDTRLQALVAYNIGRDSRLQKRSIELFDASRLPSGLTQSRFPSRSEQVIPPFSLLWIGMVHDYWMYRGEADFVRAMLAGTRSVLDAHLRRITADGLLDPIPGWLFVDWVPTWNAGTPPASKRQDSAILCLLAILAMHQAAALERALGLTAMANLYTEQASRLFARVMEKMWNAERGRLDDDGSHATASEHAQSLALLSGLANAEQASSMLRALVHDEDLTRATVYFSHYIFDALTIHGRADAWLSRLGLWTEMTQLGLHTALETPEPARSDCHAWGAHPIHHFHAGVLGVRPASPGYESIQIRPQLGSLSSARGRTAHPKGWIMTEFVRNGNSIDATIELPDGATGVLISGAGNVPLRAGRQTLRAVG